MRKAEIEYFKDKDVKIIKTDGFAHYGKIVEVNDDNILFKTDDAESLISLNLIAEIVTRGG